MISRVIVIFVSHVSAGDNFQRLMIINEIISKLIFLDCAVVLLCPVSDCRDEIPWVLVCEEQGFYEEYARRHLTRDGYEWSLSRYGNPLIFFPLPPGAIRYDLTSPQDAKTLILMASII